MRTLTMSFSTFFNTPVPSPADEVVRNLNEFQININEANRMMDEIRKQNDYNEQILNNYYHNKVINTQVNQIPQQNITPTQINNNTTIDQFIDRGQYHAPQNTPDTSMIEQLSKLNDRIDGIGKKIESINYYLEHPILIAKVVILGLGTASYYVCMTICLWCIIIYVLSENEKVKQTGYITFGIYVALQILSRCFQAFV